MNSKQASEILRCNGSSQWAVNTYLALSSLIYIFIYFLIFKIFFLILYSRLLPLRKYTYFLFTALLSLQEIKVGEFELFEHLHIIRTFEFAQTEKMPGIRSVVILTFSRVIYRRVSSFHSLNFLCNYALFFLSVFCWI